VQCTARLVITTSSTLTSCCSTHWQTRPTNKANSAFHTSGVGKWVPTSAEKAKARMVLSVSGWTRGVQVKLWISWERVSYLSAVEVRSRQGAVQMHVYLTLHTDTHALFKKHAQSVSQPTVGQLCSSRAHTQYAIWSTGPLDLAAEQSGHSPVAATTIWNINLTAGGNNIALAIGLVRVRRWNRNVWTKCPYAPESSSN